MKISKVSQLKGLSKDTIRYYEKMNLLHPAVVGAHKDYTEKETERLEGIKLLKKASFTLKEIQYFISLDEKLVSMEDIINMNDSDYDSLLKVIKDKKEEISSHIKDLELARSSLVAM